MPATAGRVRMPHNNRVSTSKALNTSDIWSKTIGHDPYAGAEDQSADKASEEKARGLLELARHQNLTGGRNASGNDDFARKMFLGLKPGKKRASDLNNSAGGNLDADTRALLEEESSSSEEEFVQVKHNNTADGVNLKGAESDESSDEDDDSSREERRRRKRKREKKRSKSKSHKRKKSDKKHRRRRDYSSSSDSDDSSRSASSGEERHRRKRRHKRKHERDRDRKRRHKSDDRDRKR